MIAYNLVTQLEAGRTWSSRVSSVKDAAATSVRVREECQGCLEWRGVLVNFEDCDSFPLSRTNGL